MARLQNGDGTGGSTRAARAGLIVQAPNQGNPALQLKLALTTSLSNQTAQPPPGATDGTDSDSPCSDVGLGAPIFEHPCNRQSGLRSPTLTSVAPCGGRASVTKGAVISSGARAGTEQFLC